MATEAPNPIYRVARWNETFETHESRKYKALTWVSLPIDFHSNGYQLMLDEFGDEAPTVYGAWCALLGVAGHSPVRGTLATQKGVGYSPERIARLAHMPAEPFRKLIKWASSETVGWLEVVTNGFHTGRLPGDCRETDLGYRTGPDLTEPNLPTTVGGGEVSDEVYREIFPFVRSVFDGFKVRHPKSQDVRMLLVATLLAQEQQLPKGSLSGLVAQVAESRDIDKPFAVLRKRLNELCTSMGFEFQQVLNRVKVPKHLTTLPAPE